MIHLYLGLNESEKLAADIDKLIELTEGRYMSLSLLRSALLPQLNQFVDSDTKSYRIVSFVGDPCLTTEAMSFEEARMQYWQCRDMQPENHYEIVENTTID